MTRRALHKLAWAAFIVSLLVWANSYWLCFLFVVASEGFPPSFYVDLAAHQGSLMLTFPGSLTDYSGPLQPEWWGFVARTSPPPNAYTIISLKSWLLAALLAIYPIGGLAWSRCRRRPKPGQCARCGRGLANDTNGVCPECGAAILTHRAHRPPL